MKRLLLALLLSALCLSFLPGTALGEDEPEREVHTSGHWEYVLREDGTAEITKYTGDVDELKIPSTLGGYSVTVIGERAFYGCRSLVDVILPDTVTTICDYAFFNCLNLAEVVVPESVLSIGGSAFSECHSLAKVTLSDGVLAIGDGAFSNCYSLTDVSLPYSVTQIGTNPFSGCSQLTTFTVSPDHPVLALVDGALINKRDKCLLCYPAGKTDTQYELPQGIETIETGAFSGCSRLVHITIPDSVAIPNGNPFAKCSGLSSFAVSPDHPSLAVIDGVLFSKPDKRLVSYPPEKTDTRYEIPQGIRIIGDGAFSCCEQLADITIPDSVTEIGRSAFASCGSLTGVAIPDSVTAIGVTAFADCVSLTEVTLPDGVTAIGNGTFAQCYSLTDIVLPEGLTLIGDGAFNHCDCLADITIPNSVTWIGYRAFAHCDNLTLTVERDSYAREYCIENELPYTYPDATDWLND